MATLTINAANANVVKEGRISLHSSKAKGKVYQRAKVYLPDTELVGKRYELLWFDELIIREVLGKSRKGRGYLLFVKS